MMKYSFIIPTYNRKDLVVRAVNSALKFVDLSLDYEIIVIDDDSTDGTFSYLNSLYVNEISSGKIKLLKNSVNSGVVRSRNIGASIASGKWLIFVDSDNEILSSNRLAFELVLASTQCKCVLFRCIDQDNNLIGFEHPSATLEYTQLLNNSYFETLGVFDRETFNLFYNDKTIEFLRRFESIAFFRALRNYGPFYLSEIVMRKYSFLGNDRLSSRTGLFKESYFMFLGHVVFLKDNFRDMTLRRFLVSALSVCYYLVQFVIYFITKKLFDKHT